MKKDRILIPFLGLCRSRWSPCQRRSYRARPPWWGGRCYPPPRSCWGGLPRRSGSRRLPCWRTWRWGGRSSGSWRWNESVAYHDAVIGLVIRYTELVQEEVGGLVPMAEKSWSPRYVAAGHLAWHNRLMDSKGKDEEALVQVKWNTMNNSYAYTQKAWKLDVFSSCSHVHNALTTRR